MFDEFFGGALEHFQKIGHVNGVLKSHFTQSKEDVFGHHTGILSIKYRRYKGHSDMIFSDRFQVGGYGCDRTGRANPDAFPAADALLDHTNCFFVYYADGLGGACSQT
jgi:hypothetical protein